MLSAGIKNSVKEATKRGCRTLGVARRRENGKMELLGLIPLFQAPRYDSVASIKLAKSLVVSAKLLTGLVDADAAYTMKLVGLDGEVLSCEDGALWLAHGSANAEVSMRVEAVSGFAEVFPEDKEQIVRILQSRGYFVAVVGDGINDAPALTIANCGIAPDKASEHARSAADMMQFNQEGLAPLIQAIQISRQTLEQSYSYLVYETVVVLQCLGLFGLCGATIFIISIYITFALGLFAGASGSSSMSALTRSTGISLPTWNVQQFREMVSPGRLAVQRHHCPSTVCFYSYAGSLMVLR